MLYAGRNDAFELKSTYLRDRTEQRSLRCPTVATTLYLSIL